MKKDEVGSVSKEGRRPVAIGIALACLIAVLGMGTVVLLVGPAAESKTNPPATENEVESTKEAKAPAKHDAVKSLEFPSLEDPQRWTRQRISSGKRHHGAIIDIYLENSLRQALESGQTAPVGTTAVLLVRDGLEQILETFTMRRFQGSSETGWIYGQLNSKGTPLQTIRRETCTACHQSEPNLYGLKAIAGPKN